MGIAFAERTDKAAVETGIEFAPKFDADGLIPVVAQDAASGTVLMVAYMNAEALGATIAKGEAVYFSRSRQCLWHKGGTSGHVQKVLEARTDCDQDVILLKVEQVGPGCCHAGYASCFYRQIGLDGHDPDSEEQSIVPLSFAEQQSYDPDEVYK